MMIFILKINDDNRNFLKLMIIFLIHVSFSERVTYGSI